MLHAELCQHALARKKCTSCCLAHQRSLLASKLRAEISTSFDSLMRCHPPSGGQLVETDTRPIAGPVALA